MPFLSSRRPKSPFDPPSTFDQILSSPVKFLARRLYSLLTYFQESSLPASSGERLIKVVCISDTHSKAVQIPSGDVLIHAGDLTDGGTVAEIQAQIDWLNGLPHPYKIAIAGNHDSFFDPRSRKLEDLDKSLDWGNIRYLESSSTVLTFPSFGNRQLNVFGAPHIPLCGGSSFAFQYQRQSDHWSNIIPRNTDILVTHTPPKYHLDLPACLGCTFLLNEVWRVRPALHVFGHVHAAHGRQVVYWDNLQRTYEKICGRCPGLASSIFDISGWILITKLIWHGASGILWRQVWGGNEDGTILINAALAYQNTGKLANPAQVVYL
ncbi:MAG: hypothetical protein M1829_002974 [Trizodia sp. TS-e1964]|nr:MAG: hypothetical protein M1829_002974 [Trizodia sp. TS-e1964]